MILCHGDSETEGMAKEVRSPIWSEERPEGPEKGEGQEDDQDQETKTHGTKDTKVKERWLPKEVLLHIAFEHRSACDAILQSDRETPRVHLGPVDRGHSRRTGGHLRDTDG